jgi:hypothetical protein
MPPAFLSVPLLVEANEHFHDAEEECASSPNDSHALRSLASGHVNEAQMWRHVARGTLLTALTVCVCVPLGMAFREGASPFPCLVLLLSGATTFFHRAIEGSRDEMEAHVRAAERLDTVADVDEVLRRSGSMAGIGALLGPRPVPWLAAAVERLLRRVETLTCSSWWSPAAHDGGSGLHWVSLVECHQKTRRWWNAWGRLPWCSRWIGPGASRCEAV